MANADPAAVAPPAPPEPPARLKRVQIRPGILPVSMESPNYLKSTPTIPQGPQDYTPAVYTFRIKSNQYSYQLLSALNAPFYVQLDHCLAVTWSVFSPHTPTRKIGIAQLQWALAFLKTIYTSQGIRTKDLETCIQTIENIVIEKYADLSEHLDLLENIDNEYGRNLSKTAPKTEFSANYNEMMKQCPNKTRKICPQTEKFYMSDDEIMRELESIKKEAGIDNIHFDEMPKDRAIDVLSAWKANQVEKIHNELRLLRCIEDTIKFTDLDNFAGYTDQGIFNL